MESYSTAGESSGVYKAQRFTTVLTKAGHYTQSVRSYVQSLHYFSISFQKFLLYGKEFSTSRQSAKGKGHTQQASKTAYSRLLVLRAFYNRSLSTRHTVATRIPI
jgi:hypothetical protein